MGKQYSKIADCLSLLFKGALFSMPLFAMAEQSASPTSQQTAPQEQKTQMMCGPDCTCGCRQGEPCHCKDKATPASQPTSAPNQQQGAMQYDYSNSYYYYGDQSCRNYCYDNQYDSCDGYDCRGYSEADRCFEQTYSYTDCHGERRPTNIDPWDITYEPCSPCGIWMPDDPVLFRPLMADPRQVCYSAAWRFNDNALTKNAIPVSYGDSFGIYRWCHVGPWNGNLQIDLEGGLWAVFDPCTVSAPLINADYYVGVPITYAYDRWQFRLRGFHISSHIGDEFLLNHPGFNRRNPSAEYVDFFIAHDFTEEIRFYAGIGVMLFQDDSWHCAPFYSEIGAELRLLSWGFLDVPDRLYGCPIMAMNFRGNADFKNHIDQTYILGYEIGKLCGLYRKLRFFLEYHDGYSLEGQFAKTATNYFSICTTYGF